MEFLPAQNNPIEVAMPSNPIYNKEKGLRMRIDPSRDQNASNGRLEAQVKRICFKLDLLIQRLNDFRK